VHVGERDVVDRAEGSSGAEDLGDHTVPCVDQHTTAVAPLDEGSRLASGE
jgi:hypothetical protein